jgi:hypothetical protein
MHTGRKHLSPSSQPPARRAEVAVGLALCAAVAIGWAAEQLVPNAESAQAMAPGWLPLAAAAVAAAGILPLDGSHQWLRARRALRSGSFACDCRVPARRWECLWSRLTMPSPYASAIVRIAQSETPSLRQRGNGRSGWWLGQGWGRARYSRCCSHPGMPGDMSPALATSVGGPDAQRQQPTAVLKVKARPR